MPWMLQAQAPDSSAQRTRASFDSMDANRDGKLSREEMPERWRVNFKRVDANQDGAISAEEHETVLKRLKQAASGKQNKPTNRPLPLEVEAKLDVPYANTDHPRQKLDLYLPKQRRTEKALPVIVFIHGGGWRGGDKGAGLNHLARYVQSGDYAGVSVSYRLTNEAQWPAQIHDCKAAIRWIKGQAATLGLDANRIAVWGTSAGGHLVSHLGTSGDVKELEGSLGLHLDQNSRVTCVVNYFGPENFLSMVRQPSTVDRSGTQNYPEALLLGGPVPEREQAAREASPVTHVSAGDAAFFTAHGTKDPLVPYAQAEEIHATLQKAGVPSLLQEMTHAGHGFRSAELDKRVAQFLAMHLRGVKSEIDTTPIAAESR